MIVGPGRDGDQALRPRRAPGAWGISNDTSAAMATSWARPVLAAGLRARGRRSGCVRSPTRPASSALPTWAFASGSPTSPRPLLDVPGGRDGRFPRALRRTVRPHPVLGAPARAAWEPLDAAPHASMEGRTAPHEGHHDAPRGSSRGRWRADGRWERRCGTGQLRAGPDAPLLAESLARFLVARCESHHAGWRACARSSWTWPPTRPGSAALAARCHSWPRTCSSSRRPTRAGCRCIAPSISPRAAAPRPSHRTSTTRWCCAIWARSPPRWTRTPGAKRSAGP